MYSGISFHSQEHAEPMMSLSKKWPQNVRKHMYECDYHSPQMMTIITTALA